MIDPFSFRRCGVKPRMTIPCNGVIKILPFLRSCFSKFNENANVMTWTSVALLSVVRSKYIVS